MAALSSSQTHFEPDDNDWESRLAWLPAGSAENPTGVEVLDCRAAALALRSAAPDGKALDRFNRLRRSDGSEVRGLVPERPMIAGCELRFSLDGKIEDGPLFRARDAEDKWDIYTYENRFYVRKSWSGWLTHVGEFEHAPHGVVVTRVHCAPDLVEDRDFAVTEFRFLIAAHLGAVAIPFPIPSGSPRTAVKEIALAAFGKYGRRAVYGSYERFAGAWADPASTLRPGFRRDGGDWWNGAPGAL